MSKIGKPTFLLIAFVVPLLLASTNTVIAHSPANMTLEYLFETETLQVTITHSVSNPQTHFIELVEIRKNTVLEISEDYTSQPTSLTFTYSYVINATIGDALEAKAICNLGGTITRSITIVDPSASTPPSSTTTPTTETANIYLLPTIAFSALAMIGILLLRKNSIN